MSTARWTLTLVPAGLVALLLGVYLPGSGGVPPATTVAPAPPDRASAPAGFSLPALDGRPVSLAQFAAMRPVLLVFWATWCPYCSAAIPGIEKLHAEAGAKGMAVLAIDVLEEPKKVKAFATAKRIGYPIVLDETGAVSRAYGVVGVPTYVVIDRAGHVRYRANTLPPDIRDYL